MTIEYFSLRRPHFDFTRRPFPGRCGSLPRTSFLRISFLKAPDGLRCKVKGPQYRHAVIHAFKQMDEIL